MLEMVKIALPAALLALAAPATGAFELLPQSPWLGGGAAAGLFPHSPLAIAANPSAAGLMEGPGASISVSRPFGLAPLDRLSMAGCGTLLEVPLAGGFELSGDGDCSEASLGVAAGFLAAPGVAAGLGAHVRRLQITGYGTGVGASADLGVAYTPLPGLYGAAAVRGLLRTDLGRSGDPACPRSLDLSLGLAPAEGVTATVGYRSAEHLPAEISVHSTYAPAEALSLFAGLQTEPTRFTVGLAVSAGPAEVSYSVAQHSELPATHSGGLMWGRCAFRPATLELGGDDGGSPEEEAFPINVNTATSRQLQTVPGIGPAKAASILAWIREHGPFQTLADLQYVPGIGAATVEGFRGYLVVE